VTKKNFSIVSSIFVGATLSAEGSNPVEAFG